MGTSEKRCPWTCSLWAPPHCASMKTETERVEGRFILVTFWGRTWGLQLNCLDLRQISPVGSPYSCELMAIKDGGWDPVSLPRKLNTKYISIHSVPNLPRRRTYTEDAPLQTMLSCISLWPLKMNTYFRAGCKLLKMFFFVSDRATNAFYLKKNKVK